MFQFLRSRPPTKDPSDPFETPTTASAWFRQLPAHDVIGRQQQVIRAFDAMRRAGKRIDLERLSAIEWLDAALGPDRRQLQKQYANNTAGSAALAERIWTAAYDISQGFIRVYKNALDQALASVKIPQWKRVLPQLLARLIHFYGTDAELRVLRNERWIPGKWLELHRLYQQAVELGIERVPVTVVAAEPGDAPSSVEEEYLFVLFTHLLNTGTFTPAEVDWVSAQLRAWCHGLVLETTPHLSGGFCVDIAGKMGLVRCSGTDRGATFRYLDSASVVYPLERAITTLRQASGADTGIAGPSKEQRLAIFEKLRLVLSQSADTVPDRQPRMRVSVPVEVWVGLLPICQQLALKGKGDDSFEESEAETQSARESDAALDPPRVGEGKNRLRGVLPDRGASTWQLEDRSSGGLLLAAVGGAGQNLTLGALIAVRELRAPGWVLGVVRRLNREPNRLEAGVSIISTDQVAITLHAKRHAREDMGFVVDGIDVSTIGTRFDGIYLPPPSRPENPVSMKTMIIPTSEYAHGRNVVLITTRSVYTVALHKAFEQRPEWTWAAVEIVSKIGRG
jgi:hypothetical protein